MAQNTLTFPAVAKALREGKPCELKDGGSLSLIVKGKNAGRWLYRGRVRGGNRTVINLNCGTAPETGLSEARAKRDEYRALLNQGINPNQQKRLEKEETRRKEQEAVQTFEAVAREWFAKRKEKCEQSTKGKYLRILKKHVFPVIGSKPVKELDRATLIELLKPIYSKTDIAENVCRLIKNVFDYAIDMTYTESNPAYRLNQTLPAKPPVKHAAYLKTERQIGLLCLRIKAYGGIPSTRYALKLALLMGDALRNDALRNSQWGFIDFSQGTWTVPRAMMKRKTGDDYTVPLSGQAVALLKELYELEPHEDTDLIFPGLGPGRPLGETTLNRAIRIMGYSQEDLCFHGLRGTFSTWANSRRQDGDMRFDPDLIEQALDHKEQNLVRGSYAHTNNLEARRKMLQAWADALDEMADRAANSAPA